jgi:hypothetical protein
MKWKNSENERLSKQKYHRYIFCYYYHIEILLFGKNFKFIQYDLKLKEYLSNLFEAEKDLFSRLCCDRDFFSFILQTLQVSNSLFHLISSIEINEEHIYIFIVNFFQIVEINFIDQLSINIFERKFKFLFIFSTNCSPWVFSSFQTENFKVQKLFQLIFHLSENCWIALIWIISNQSNLITNFRKQIFRKNRIKNLSNFAFHIAN